MCVQFTINLGGHWFEFIAFVLNMIEDYDFILGAKAMYELEMDVSYSKMRIEFAMTGLPLKLQSSVMILPKTQKVITLAFEDIPQTYEAAVCSSAWISVNDKDVGRLSW